MFHVFRHRRYEIIKVKNYEAGECNFTSRKIAFNPDVNGKLGLDTAIHEGIHACLPDLDEPAVTQTATDIARLLWRLGYRKKI